MLALRVLILALVMASPHSSVPPPGWCAACTRDFETEQGLICHLNFQLGGLCKRLISGAIKISPPAPEQQSGPNEKALQYRELERRESALHLTTDARLLKLMPGTHVQFWKDELQSKVMPIVRKHLQTELKEKVTCSPDELATIIARCTDIFNGMESSVKEHTLLMSRPDFELVKPRRRVLDSWTVDGAKVEAICWDLPLDATLLRMFKHAPRALRQVLDFQKRMHLRATNGSRPEVVAYVDLCDGKIYREHAALGDEARRNNPTHHHEDPNDPNSELIPTRVVMSVLVYYDGIDPANAIGPAKIVHSMGCFYVAIVDLNKGTRSSAQCILPVTFALDKWVKKYSRKVLVGDPSDVEGYKTCTSLGATLNRMSDVAETPTEWNLTDNGVQHKIRIEVYALALLADFPAAALMGFSKRSVSARRFDRRTMIDQDNDAWASPNSFLEGRNLDLPHQWELRTQEQLQNQEHEYIRLRREDSATAASEYLQACTARPLHCMPTPHDHTACPHRRCVVCPHRRRVARPPRRRIAHPHCRCRRMESRRT